MMKVIPSESGRQIAVHCAPIECGGVSSRTSNRRSARCGVDALVCDAGLKLDDSGLDRIYCGPVRTVQASSIPDRHDMMLLGACAWAAATSARAARKIPTMTTRRALNISRNLDKNRAYAHRDAEPGDATQGGAVKFCVGAESLETFWNWPETHRPVERADISPVGIALCVGAARLLGRHAASALEG